MEDSGTGERLRKPGRPKKLMEKFRATSIVSKSSMIFGLIVTIATVGNVITSWLQYRAAKTNADQSSAQTDKLIQAAQLSSDAADRNAHAAINFATSASQIQNGVAAAVVALGTQARALEQSRTSSEAASRRSLGEMRSEFEDAQRPFLYVTTAPSPLKAGELIHADLHFLNYGRTPAVQVTNQGRIFDGKQAPQDADLWFKGSAADPNVPSKGSSFVVGPISDFSKEGASFSTVFNKQIITEPYLLELKSYDFSIVLVGRLKYADLSGKRYFTDYCFSYFVTGALPRCPVHNDIR